MSQTKTNFSIKQEIHENLSLSIPLVFSQLIYASSNFIGTAFVAKLGKDALAASVLVSTIWLSLSVLFFGLLNAVSVIISHQHGARDRKGMSETMGQSFLLGALVCIFIIIALCSMSYFLKWSAQPPEVLEIAYAYTYSLLWTVPGLIILILLEQFLAGIGHTKLVLKISFLVVPIEIPLIYMLIFGKLGLPAFGVAGVGYGFAVTYTLTTVVLVIYLLKSKKYKKYNIFSNIFTANYSRLKELIVLGFPIGLMHVIEVTSLAIMTFWIAQFGTTLTAAHQIVMQYLSFVITIVFSMSQALTIRVGHVIGENNYQNLHQPIYIGMVISFIPMLFIALCFALFPTYLINFDIDILNPSNLRLVKDTTLLLSICSVLLIFDNFRIIAFGALRGLKDSRFPMYASLVSFWIVGLSVAYALGFYFNFGGQGIWWGITVGVGFGAILMLIRLRFSLVKVKQRLMSSNPIH